MCLSRRTSVKSFAVFVASPVFVGDREFLRSPQRDAGMTTVFRQQIETQTKIRSSILVAQPGFCVLGDSANDLHPGFLRGSSVPHEFDSCERCQVLQVRFASTCTSAGTDFVVDIQASPDDRRIADSAWNLERQPAGGRRAADVTI